MHRALALLLVLAPNALASGIVKHAVVTEIEDQTNIRPVGQSPAIRKALAGLDPKLRACGDAALQAQGSLRTTLTFRWTLQGGRVVDLEPVANNRADEALSACFVTQLRSLRVGSANAEVLSMAWELEARATTQADD